MADIAAFNAFKASTRIGADLETLDPTPDTPMATAGTRHLSIDYSAMVGESKRCQFCLSTPCKANLEIQVKFDKVRVSLDWVLSGFVPEFKQQDHSRRPGQVHVA
ncbi:hypothetical protein BGX31_005898 [Mortierella sp. GBA43]|nr:hypothetical protein BGX31_005898 [Mortierella sp. GBA43]